MTQKSTPNILAGDGFDFIKKMWGGLPMPSGLAPTTDINEIDKRIADMRTVEQWLNLNLNLLRASIQGMEVQRGTLAALQALGATTESHRSTAAVAAQESSKVFVENAAAWWGAMQEQFSKVTAAAMSASAPPGDGPSPSTSEANPTQTDKASSTSKKPTRPSTRSRS